jgi:hypothetical protein
MRKIQDIKMLNVDGKEIVIISGNYQGQPMMCYKYDILIGPEAVIKRYYKDLVPEHQVKQGWMPKIQYI